MKKFLISGVVAAFALTGCFKGGDIASVKAGVMDFDKSLKVGDAFENWGECTHKKWSEFKTANGRKIVQFECRSTQVQDFVRTAKANFPKVYYQDARRDLEETTTTVQWTINTDDSFELTSFQKLYKWADGSVTEWTPLLDRLLKNVYENVAEFDIAKLDPPRGANAASDIRIYLDMVRGYGKKVSPPTVSPVATATTQPTNPTEEKKAADNAESIKQCMGKPNATAESCAAEAEFVGD